ncbi:MAG TPA: hypothetical protein VHV51_14855 [Polyangiaceae bacterium]|nr:hypothetical protein [Polyangiaceae bacterium]
MRASSSATTGRLLLPPLTGWLSDLGVIIIELTNSNAAYSNACAT